MATTSHVTGTAEKDRTKDSPDDFPFTGTVTDDPKDQEGWLTRVNKELADLQLGLASSGILPGQEGNGYAIPSPGLGLSAMGGISVYKNG